MKRRRKLQNLFLKNEKGGQKRVSKKQKKSRPVTDFRKIIKTTDEIQNDVRREIAEEIAMNMADGDRGFHLNDLVELFPEMLSTHLEKELQILKSELACAGIKLFGNLKPEGKHLIHFGWITD